MPMLTDRALLAATKEATFGTDAFTDFTTPTNTHVLVVGQPSLEFVGNERERNYFTNHIGGTGFTLTERYARLSFQTEIRGRGSSGSAGSTTLFAPTTPWRDDPLMRGCGMVPRYAASSASVIYRPTSNNLLDLSWGADSAPPAAGNPNSLSLRMNLDGMTFALSGCRGTFDISAPAGDIGIINWQFSGVYKPLTNNSVSSGVFDEAIPTASYDVLSVQPPIVQTSTFALSSFAGSLGTKSLTGTTGAGAAMLENFSFSMGNQVEMRKSVNHAQGLAGFHIRGRNCGGSINPEMPSRAGFDLLQYIQDGVTGSLAAVIGATGGSTFEFAAPLVQLRNGRMGDRAGIRTIDLPFFMLGSNSDDDFSITIK